MEKIRIAALILIGFMLGAGAGYTEIIYTRDGEKIEGKVSEITEDTVWVEITKGEIIEYIGIDKMNVEKILNDDGSKYNYPPTDKKEEVGSGEGKEEKE